MIHSGGGFLWITSKTGSFGYMTRSVSLLRIRKEWILPALTLNLTIVIHDIDQLFDKTAYLYGHFCSPFYPFYRGGKIDLHNPIVLVTTKKTTIHNFAGVSHKTLLFNYNTYLISTILKLTLQNTMKDQETCNLVSSRVVLSPGYRRYCGSFLWKWMKNNPFLDTSFLFSTKNPNDPIFDLILDFSKETHP